MIRLEDFNRVLYGYISEISCLGDVIFVPSVERMTQHVVHVGNRNHETYGLQSVFFSLIINKPFLLLREPSLQAQCLT